MSGDVSIQNIRKVVNDIIVETKKIGRVSKAINERLIKTTEELETLQQEFDRAVSIGVACFRPGEPLEDFINRSDRALYLAKDTGRNRVATESDVVIKDTNNLNLN